MWRCSEHHEADVSIMDSTWPAEYQMSDVSIWENPCRKFQKKFCWNLRSMRFLPISLPCSLYMDSSPSCCISPCLFETPDRFRDACTVLRCTTGSWCSDQISEHELYRLSITSALIYQVQPQLLTYVHLTRHLDPCNRLERPHLAPSVIDCHLHIVSC